MIVIIRSIWETNKFLNNFKVVKMSIMNFEAEAPAGGLDRKPNSTQHPCVEDLCIELSLS